MKYTVRVLTLLAMLNSFSIYPQLKKELTLSDAVLKQSGDLGPSRITGLNWLNETTYMFNKGKGNDEKLLAFDLKKKKEKVLLTMAEFKSEFGNQKDEIKLLPNFSRVANNLMSFQLNNTHYLFDTSKKKFKKFGRLDEKSSNLHYSPTGQQMAYVLDNNIYLAVRGTDESVENRITGDGSADLVYGKSVSRSEFGIEEGIFWNHSGSAFAFYRNDQSDVSNYPLVNLNETPAAYRPIKYPMAGGKSEKISVVVYQLDGNEITFKTTEDEVYICSVNWTPDDKQIVLVTLNRDQNHMRFERYDAQSGAFIGTEYEERDEKYVEPLYPILFTADDGSEFVYLSQKDGWMHAYLRMADFEKQLTKGQWVLTKYLGMNSDRTFLYFEGTAEIPTENHIYKVNVADGSFHRISKNTGTYHAVLSPSGQYMITYFSSTDVPGRILIADDEGLVVKQLLSSPDPLEAYNIARPEIFTIENSSGNTLYARMVKPHDFRDDGKYPVLIYVYNGPHVQLVKNKWWAGASLWMNYLAEKGYIVFTLDGRGSYNRGKEFEQAIFRNLSAVEMEDQMAGLRYLKSLSYIDSNRLAVHGWSYGGFMTTSLLLKYPDAFKVGVAGGPVTSWRYYEVMYTERYMDTPETNVQGYNNTDLTNFAEKLKAKLLLIHGLSDNVVVPQHNLTLVKKFIDEGIQVDFFPYPGHEHNVRGKDKLHLMTKILGYIEQNNQ